MGRSSQERRAGRERRRKLTYAMAAILAVVSIGPLLCVTIQQVCVTKCLLVRRLPKMSSDMDDVLLITLFLFFVLLNYLTCCVVWSLCRRGLGSLSGPHNLLYSRGDDHSTTLIDPKITRSGRPYGYRKARYTTSDSSQGSRESGL